MSEVRTGSCLCGGISYTITGVVREIIACHCTQCRKQTGHYYAASRVHRDQLAIRDTGKLLRWYRSSEWASRGFCGKCGSSLFWKCDDSECWSFLAGSVDSTDSVDGATKLEISYHIFTADKGDYYKIDDSMPQFLGGKTD